MSPIIVVFVLARKKGTFLQLRIVVFRSRGEKGGRAAPFSYGTIFYLKCGVNTCRPPGLTHATATLRGS